MATDPPACRRNNEQPYRPPPALPISAAEAIDQLHGGPQAVSADRPLTPGIGTWSLDSPAAGWITVKSLAPLTAGTTYALYGRTKDNSWSASSISFTPADRGQLTPGQVRNDSRRLGRVQDTVAPSI